jgi:hypothetical protein
VYKKRGSVEWNVIVSADKAPNNIVFVCKSHYIYCLVKELGIDNSLGNSTYTPTTLTTYFSPSVGPRILPLIKVIYLSLTCKIHIFVPLISNDFRYGRKKISFIFSIYPIEAKFSKNSRWLLGPICFLV